MATIFIATCPVCHQESRRFTANHIAWERGEFGVVTVHEDCWEKITKTDGDKVRACPHGSSGPCSVCGDMG